MRSLEKWLVWFTPPPYKASFLSNVTRTAFSKTVSKNKKAVSFTLLV